MDVGLAAQFLRTHHRAVLATVRASGRPQLSPVTAAADSEGRVLVSTRQTSMKVRNLTRNPSVSVCVMTDAFYGDWIQVDGTAEIIGLPGAMDLLVSYYRAVAGEHPDWDDYRAAMEREQRVMLRITVTSAGPDRRG